MYRLSSFFYIYIAELREAWFAFGGSGAHPSTQQDPVGIQLICAEVGVALSRGEALEAVEEMDLDGKGGHIICLMCTCMYVQCMSACTYVCNLMYLISFSLSMMMVMM